MPRTTEAKQRLREEQRVKILESAGKVFVRKGMAATMADVAAEAELSQGLAYRYFASKEAIFRALIEQTLQSSDAEFQLHLEMAGTPEKRLTLLVSQMVEIRRERPEFFQLLDQALSYETTLDDLRELIRRRSQIFFDLLKQLIVEGQASGEIAGGDPDQLALAVAACLEGLTSLALRVPSQLKEHCPDAEMILQMLKPRSDLKERGKSI
jgi:AcrR family transcriptional regulator